MHEPSQVTLPHIVFVSIRHKKHSFRIISYIVWLQLSINVYDNHSKQIVQTIDHTIHTGVE